MLDDEGGNVFAVEKQLLTIARAFLALAVGVILDEATSSVDTRAFQQHQGPSALTGCQGVLLRG